MPLLVMLFLLLKLFLNNFFSLWSDYYTYLNLFSEVRYALGLWLLYQVTITWIKNAFYLILIMIKQNLLVKLHENSFYLTPNAGGLMSVTCRLLLLHFHGICPFHSYCIKY